MTEGKINRAADADSSDLDIEGTNLGRHVRVLGGVLDTRH